MNVCWQTKVGLELLDPGVSILRLNQKCMQQPDTKFYKNSMTYWPAGGGRGQNPENTAQGHSELNQLLEYLEENQSFTCKKL